jgi:hypothetical protein
MKEPARLSLPVLLLVGVWSPAAGGGDWPIPDPRTAAHPGQKHAPASSPTTYDDEAGFKQRAGMILMGLAQNDLGKWRKGYFRGGDPGKYLPGAAMARLILNPADAEPRKYMNDDRSYKEHYHFAAVNWARFYPIFKDALTEETRRRLAERAARYSAYHSGKGTENHKVMWYTSALVLPHYLEGGMIGRMSKVAVLRKMKQWLRSYARGLYAAGQGEWDSSTYLMFDVNGMLNIYDFSPDPQCRLLAKAALDWMLTAYALKYTDGVFTAPNQRGFAAAPVEKIADRCGWLWWNASAKLTPDHHRHSLYTMHAITSGYRPNRVICNIARRKLAKLPFESRNSKPDYWGGTSTPKPNVYQETVYATRHYTMGSLWSGHGGQITRFQLVASSDAGGIVFTGGHPRASDHTGKKTGIRFTDGIGRYDQTAQIGGTHICMSLVPADETHAYSFFSVPSQVRYGTRGSWFVIQADNTYLGLRGLGEKPELGETELSDKERRKGRKPQAILKFRGRKTGFVLITSDGDTYRSAGAFADALNHRVKIDTTNYASDMRLVLTDLADRKIEMQYQAGQPRASVKVDGKATDFSNWPVYDGPYVSQKGGVLTVNDGSDGFVIDFSGVIPVYKPWKP